jgi:SAM-dependent methyltransferase
MRGPQLYDIIGAGYRDYRRPDPRIAAAILDALGDAKTIINVGAGTGSYEPQDRFVVAVEPSATMIGQRRERNAVVVQASAMALPFPDKSFDAAMAVLTIHHWPERTRGLAEMKRVTNGPLAILTWEPPPEGFWLTADYLPHFLEADRELFPPWFREDEDSYSIRSIPVPCDCADGFLCAYWQRPSSYLNPAARGAISTFSRVGNFESGLDRLRRDLADGTWERRYGHLRDIRELDLGYRLVVAN